MIETLYDLAQRYVGIAELGEQADHPLIVWWLSLCAGFGPHAHDETPWCSAFMNGMAWEWRLPRSKSAAARSWLKVGVPAKPEDAKVGFDVVVLARGEGVQPGPEILDAPGHVGLFAGFEGERISLLAGNQGNAVSVASFAAARLLGVRRLA